LKLAGEIDVSPGKLKETALRFDLDLVVVFGSFASGHADSRSDLDIAARSRTPPESREAASWKEGLYLALVDAFSAEGIDLIVINDADPLLAAEVARGGTALYEREPGLFDEFYLYALKRLADSWKIAAWEKEYIEQAR
jgi:predicted nucleotidyltransferase